MLQLQVIIQQDVGDHHLHQVRGEESTWAIRDTEAVRQRSVQRSALRRRLGDVNVPGMSAVTESEPLRRTMREPVRRIRPLLVGHPREAERVEGIRIRVERFVVVNWRGYGGDHRSLGQERPIGECHVLHCLTDRDNWRYDRCNSSVKSRWNAILVRTHMA